MQTVPNMQSTSPQDWKRTAYERWVEGEGVPVIRGLSLEDPRAVPVAHWERKGVPGSFINLIGSEDVVDAYVLELPPGNSTKVQKHFFEEMVYVLSGRGALTVWNHRGDKQAFEWRAGSLFSIPLNAFHQFHNGSGTERARYLAITSAKLHMNLIHNNDFIFNCPYDFTDRFGGDPGHFSGEGKAYPGRIWETNFVADVLSMKLQEWKERGAGGRNIMLEIGNCSLGAHISEFPVGTYKKAHRHGPGAHVIILAGDGFSLMWKDGEDVQKIDWKAGSVLVPPDRWFHQHFNVGATPARYLAIRANSRKYRRGNTYDEKAVEKSVKLGGDQIEYEDQEPWIHETFVKECRARGVEVRMDAFIKP
jgi:quercetin dioxygenase-like cupin family protein